MKQTARLGSVSSATMRTQDLIPSFCWELRSLGMRSKELTQIERRCNRVNSEKYFMSDDAEYDLETLFDMLDGYAPTYCYFGAHPGDGSDYGFWVSENMEYDFDGLTVSDLAEMPGRYSGEMLFINDHGNMTLYTVKNGKTSEAWSVV